MINSYYYAGQPHATKFTLVLAEAALEMVPAEIAGHPAVSSRARRLGAKASETLLDRSYHHAAMKNLDESWKRGRPDIVHFALVEALATPLFINNKLDVFVHTYGDKVISVAEGLRIPKSFFRFEGVMTNLFRDGAVKSDDGKVLLEIQDGTLEELIRDLEPDRVVGLSSAGVQSSAQQVVAKNRAGHCAFVVGAFPKGHFSEKTTQLFNCTYSIQDIGLETHVVIARILYECEKAT
ncbi:ribosome biogenesis protein [Nitrososphaera sp.]|uniref:ribosome biogenesis protein n=1 Tax=Nitrososphaera sp. TaxID=1971748 RepID=UPI0025E27FA3|nr:ribosome biogenesis protein [Nitrososphaera sp.]